MKKIIILVISAVSIYSLAAAPKMKSPKNTSQKICDALQTKVDSDCADFICGEAVSNGDFSDIDECTSAPDYAEYAQGACEELPTLEDLVADYNRSHPKSKIKCEE